MLQKWHADFELGNILSTSPLRADLHAILGQVNYEIFNFPPEPLMETSSQVNEDTCPIPEVSSVEEILITGLW